MQNCKEPAKSQIEKVAKLLGESYRTIYRHGRSKKYWDDVRSTALVGLAIANKGREDSRWRKLVRRYLMRNQITGRDDETHGSWNAEVWDTALSIIALQKINQNLTVDEINEGLEWMYRIYTLNERGNWNDEPWETSWALLAILTVGRPPKGMDLGEPLNWLLDLRKPGEATIVSAHYNAFYLLIYSLLKKETIWENTPSTSVNAKKLP